MTTAGVELPSSSTKFLEVKPPGLFQVEKIIIPSCFAYDVNVLKIWTGSQSGEVEDEVWFDGCSFAIFMSELPTIPLVDWGRVDRNQSLFIRVENVSVLSLKVQVGLYGVLITEVGDGTQTHGKSDP